MGNDKDLDRVRLPSRIASTFEPATPGRGTNTQTMSPATAAYVGTLKAPEAHRTGNTFVDQGVACHDVTSTDCFLTDDQRRNMVIAYHSRVASAGAAYLTAAMSAEIKQRLKKEPEQSNFLLEILLDVIGTVASSAVKKGLKAAIEHVEALAEITEVIAPAISLGKKQGTSAIRQAASDGDKPESAALSMLSILKAQSAGIYQRLRENAIAGANDTLLSALFEAFDEQFHTTEVYGAAIADKLERFATSGVDKLGVQRNKRMDPFVRDRRLANGDEGNDFREAYDKLDTKAFWVRTPGGPRLALYARGHSGQVDADANGVGTDEHAAMAYQIQSYVSDEFISIAVAMHEQKWGMPPAEHAFGVPELYMLGVKS